jgi:hypothetical protein
LKSWVIASVGGAAFASMAGAQEAPPAAADPIADTAAEATIAPEASGCELHVWPAAGLSLTRQRALDNRDTSYLSGALGGLIGTSGRERIENNTANVGTSGAQTGSPMDGEVQLGVLKDADLTALLGLAGYRTVFHDTALDKRTLRVEQGRYDRTTNVPCYADLVLADVVYSREYANGQNVKTFVRFRDFADNPAPVRRYATWIQTDLEYDREKAEASEDVMNAELRAGLATNLKKFAKLLKDRP